MGPPRRGARTGPRGRGPLGRIRDPPRRAGSARRARPGTATPDSRRRSRRWRCPRAAARGCRGRYPPGARPGASFGWLPASRSSPHSSAFRSVRPAPRRRPPNAVELAEHQVASRVDDVSLVRLDEALRAFVEFADEGGGSFLVPPHHPAEGGDVDHQDGGACAGCGAVSGHSMAGPVRTATLVAPRVAPSASLKRRKTRLAAGSKGIGPAAAMKTANVGVALASISAVALEAARERQAPVTGFV